MFVSRDFIPAGSPLVNGVIPDLLGFSPRLTTAVGNTSYWFDPSFMQVAVQQALNISTYDMGAEGYRSSRVNCDVLMGIKQVSNVKVVTLS